MCMCVCNSLKLGAYFPVARKELELDNICPDTSYYYYYYYYYY